MPDLLAAERPKLEAGDIVGFCSWDWTGAIINLGSLGVPFVGLSHVGILADRPAWHDLPAGAKRRNDPEYWDALASVPLLYESTTLASRPCVIGGRRVAGVQAHEYAGRLRDFRGRVWIYRPAEPFTPRERLRLTRNCLGEIGTRYDYRGAWQSRSLLVGWLLRRLLYSEDLKSQFCSELVALMESCSGRLLTPNVSAWNPNRLMRHQVRQGERDEPWRWK